MQFQKLFFLTHAFEVLDFLHNAQLHARFAVHPQLVCLFCMCMSCSRGYSLPVLKYVRAIHTEMVVIVHRNCDAAVHDCQILCARWLPIVLIETVSLPTLLLNGICRQ